LETPAVMIAWAAGRGHCSQIRQIRADCRRERTRLLEVVEQEIEAPFDNTSGCVELSESAKRVLSSIKPPDI